MELDLITKENVNFTLYSVRALIACELTVPFAIFLGYNIPFEIISQKQRAIKIKLILDICDAAMRRNGVMYE